MEITINTILAKIDQTVDEDGSIRTFGIRYLKKGGLIGEKLKVRKGVEPKRLLQTGGSHPKGRIKYSLKAKGVIKLFDMETDEFRDIKVSTIFQFRDHRSDTWQNRKQYGH